MNKRTIAQAFICSAGALLSITAISKFVSAAGSAHILQNPDPIFGVPFRIMFWSVGALELAVALICFIVVRPGISAGATAWLTTGFFLYRLGLVWVGYDKPCSCLGNLTDALHIPPERADLMMKIVLGYLLIGSYATLLWLWKQARGNNSPVAPSVPPSTV